MATPPEDKNINYPEIFSPAYSDDDITHVKRIVDWLSSANGREGGHKNQRSQAKLSRAAGVNNSTFNRIIKGTYPSSPSEHLSRALQAIENNGERHARNSYTRLASVKTSVTKTIYAVCHRVNIYKDMGVIAGKPGTGKTDGIAQYCATNINAILINATWNMIPGLLLDDLVEITGAEVKTSSRHSTGTQAQKLRGVIRALKDQDRIIIIDEADLMSPSTLETLRRINDLAGVGIVLAGEPRLHAMISNKEGRFGRIQSRIGFWIKVIKNIERADCRLLIEATLTDEPLSEEIHDAFWQVCDGSARVLSKLLPNVRDFGLAQGHELSPNLIFSVAQSTLRITNGGELK